MNDRDVIRAFVLYLRENGHPGLKVDRWPEDENRNSSEIDAVAGPLAVCGKTPLEAVFNWG